jgi:DNA repair protein RAD51/DNA repair protein RadA
MELGDLNGVGAVTEERLDEAGVQSLDDLAEADPSELEDAGMSENKAEKLIRRANKQTVIVSTGADVKEELEQKDNIPTGLEVLDTHLQGGLREGHIVAAAGGTGAGKTQLAFNSMVTAVEETGKPAVYIETEPGRYSPSRLDQLANEPDTQEQIYRVEAYDLDQQELAYEKIRDMDTEFSLIVVDSFTANFRLSEDFEGRGSLSQRSTEMGRQLNGLRDMAQKHDAPTLITAQIYGDPSGYGSPEAIYGGSLFLHSVNYILMMAQDRGSLRKAKIMNHPEVSEEEVYVNITDETLESMENV